MFWTFNLWPLGFDFKFWSMISWLLVWHLLFVSLVWRIRYACIQPSPCRVGMRMDVSMDPHWICPYKKFSIRKWEKSCSYRKISIGHVQWGSMDMSILIPTSVPLPASLSYSLGGKVLDHLSNLCILQVTAPNKQTQIQCLSMLVRALQDR